MENYIVSARKYRPATFESVVGQRALTITLKNAIATGKLAHAYLFCGPRGVGKTTCARSGTGSAILPTTPSILWSFFSRSPGRWSGPRSAASSPNSLFKP